MRSIQFVLLAIFSVVWPLSAQAKPAIDALVEALRIADVVQVMRAEGLEYGADIAAEMFPNRAGGAWPLLVDRIYAADTLERTVREQLAIELSEVDLAPLTTFFASPTGQQITELEIVARRALLAPEVEEAAAEAARSLGQTDPELDALLHDFIAVNDLVEANVVGALNASYAFYTGLAEGDAFEGALTQEQIVTDVWSQEDDIRAETEEWLLTYLALAYGPMDRDGLETYVELSGTPEGQALNRALFAAYDTMYVSISRQLGVGAAQFLAGQDL